MLLETSLKAHNSTKKKFFPKWQDLIVHCLSFSLFSSWVKALPAHSFHLFPVIKWVWCVLLNSKITCHKLWCFFQLVMHVRKRLGTVCFYFSLVLFNKRGELIICLFQFLAFSFWPHNLNSKKKKNAEHLSQVLFYHNLFDSYAECCYQQSGDITSTKQPPLIFPFISCIFFFLNILFYSHHLWKNR